MSEAHQYEDDRNSVGMHEVLSDLTDRARFRISYLLPQDNQDLSYAHESDFSALFRAAFLRDCSHCFSLTDDSVL